MQTPDISHLQTLLGCDLHATRLAHVEEVSATPKGAYKLVDLRLTTTGGVEIPALLTTPTQSTTPVPAVIYAHAHGNTYHLGREELVDGRGSLVRPYAEDLADLGLAALCLDMPCFGGRQTPPESALSKALAWHGKTLFGQMLAELAAGVSFLAAHPMVDADRIGALGFSMGSTHAWWLAALDDRIRAASALCSFADLEALVASGAHDGHGPYMTVPGLLAQYRSGQIAGLAAPRALQICVGLQDWSTPPKAFAQGRRDLEAAFDAQDALHQLEFHIEPDHGHKETPAMREAVLDFLARNLGRRHPGP